MDYEDFLRQRGLALWDREDPRRKGLVARRCTTADCVAQWVKEQHGQTGQNGPSGPKQNTNSPSIKPTSPIKSTKPKESNYPELAANAALVLIGVACTLLDRQLASLAAAFEREGGFTERLYRVRKSSREYQR